MGNSSSTIFVSDLLKYIADNKIQPNDQEFYLNVSDSNATVIVPKEKSILIQELKDYGIETKDSTEYTEEDITTLYKVIHAPLFWSKHYHIHPNSKRVSKFLFVHRKYREQAQELLNLLHHSKEKNEVNERLLYTEFIKFHNKIESHSKFEDEQLFKFFRDQSSLKLLKKEQLSILTAQHDQVREEKELINQLEAMSQSPVNGNEVNLETIGNLLETYVMDLLQHMALEEQTLVPAWLNLSTEEYARYRTYLSWKYSFVY